MPAIEASESIIVRTVQDVSYTVSVKPTSAPEIVTAMYGSTPSRLPLLTVNTEK